MQFWRMFTQKFVSIYLDDQTLTGVLFTGKYPNIQIMAYQTFNLDRNIIQDLVLCNPTLLKNYILSFITKYNLNIAQCGLILAGSKIVENLNNSNHSNLVEYKFSQLTIDNSVDGTLSQSWSYAAHIPVGIALQYQLLFIRQRLNLAEITSFNGALLGLLKTSDFEITSDLKNLVLSKNPVFNFGVNLNLTEYKILLACLGLYISWEE